jgi:hypothetical protein
MTLHSALSLTLFVSTSRRGKRNNSFFFVLSLLLQQIFYPETDEVAMLGSGQVVCVVAVQTLLGGEVPYASDDHRLQRVLPVVFD